MAPPSWLFYLALCTAPFNSAPPPHLTPFFFYLHLLLPLHGMASKNVATWSGRRGSRKVAWVEGGQAGGGDHSCVSLWSSGVG